MAKPRISSRQIEAFVSVAECISFTAAAQRLDLTTSAISGLISELENTVGARLFERSTRRVVLNSSGRLLLPSALAFHRSLRNIERVAETLSQTPGSRIRVAAPMVMASAILPPIIAAFQAARPNAEVELVDSGVEWLGERVANGEVDFAVGPDRATDDSVVSEQLLPTRWVVWLSPLHPLAQKPVLRWRDLKGVRFHTGGHDHERIIEQAMAGLARDEQIVPGPVFDNISTALGLASANLGVTLCPAYVAPLAKAFNLEMRRVIDPEVTRYVMLYSAANRPRSEAANAFAELLREHFKAATHSEAD